MQFCGSHWGVGLLDACFTRSARHFLFVNWCRLLLSSVILSLAGCSTPGIFGPPPPGIYCPENRQLLVAAEEEIGALQDDIIRRTGFRLGLTVPVTIKPVSATGRDRMGVPYASLVGSRVYGGVTFTGGQIRMIVPVMADGTFHRPSLRHELLHALILPGGRTGHPPEYKQFAYRWRDPKTVRFR